MVQIKPVTSAYLTTVQSSHVPKFEARILTSFQTGTNPVGTVVDLGGGTVNLSATADNWATADVTVKGAWPSKAGDLLMPYGNELWLRCGVDLGRSGVEWVPLGYFQIRTPSQDTAPNGPIRLSCFDRNRGLIRGRLLSPIQFSASQTFGSAIDTLVRDIYPDATIEWDDSTDMETLGRQVLVEQDRFGSIRDLITSRGKICYWDYRGTFVIRSLPDATRPVATIAAGAGGALVQLSRTITADGVYNAMVASGEGADETPPVRGVAIDSNPLSPTVFGGRFGKVPEFYTSQMLTTTSQAERAAATLLRKRLGLPYTVDFQTVPNPALEPYDPVTVSTGDGDQVHVLDTLSIPVGATAGSMRATTRQTVSA